MDVRDFLTELLGTTDLGLMTDEQLARMLGVKTRKIDSSVDSDNKAILEEIRIKIKEMKDIESELIKKSTLAVGFRHNST